MATSTIKQGNLVNIQSITLVTSTETTGTTGNIALPYTNNGKTLVFGGYLSGSTATVTPFVSATNNYWFVKIRDAESNNTVNNTQVNLRYYVLTLA